MSASEPSVSTRNSKRWKSPKMSSTSTRVRDGVVYGHVLHPTAARAARWEEARPAAEAGRALAPASACGSRARLRRRGVGDLVRHLVRGVGGLVRGVGGLVGSVGNLPGHRVDRVRLGTAETADGLLAPNGELVVGPGQVVSQLGGVLHELGLHLLHERGKLGAELLDVGRQLCTKLAYVLGQLGAKPADVGRQHTAEPLEVGRQIGDALARLRGQVLGPLGDDRGIGGQVAQYGDGRVGNARDGIERLRIDGGGLLGHGHPSLFSRRNVSYTSGSTRFCRSDSTESASTASSTVWSERGWSSRPARTYSASAEIRSALAICWSTSADGLRTPRSI